MQMHSLHPHAWKGGEQSMYDFGDFLREEDGITTVEIILILLVLIALVLVFKNQLTGLVNTILSKAVKQANQV